MMVTTATLIAVKSMTQIPKMAATAETAFEALGRGGRGGRALFARSGIEALDALREARRPPGGGGGDALREVVEISGAAQAGKTELAMRAVATCVLPRAVAAEEGEGAREIHLGGENGSVVFFDSDRRLNVARLAAIVAAPLEQACRDGRLTQARASEVARECLERVFLYRCPGSLEVLSTLHSLTTDFLQAQNVKLVVFDSVAAHYWQDLETDPVSAGFHVSVPLAIQQLTRRHTVAVLCIKPTLFQPRGGNRAPEYLSQTWQKLVTLRLFTESLDGHSQFRVSHLGDAAEERVFDFTIEHAGVRAT